ncbi:4Fe-4S dicluster domain-containing protein [Chloroflexota bacterium]
MKKVYVREEVCMGCSLCEVYCKLQHAKSKDLIKAFKKETPSPLPRLRVEINGAISFSLHCQQCDDAPCAYFCLTGAITRDLATGRVMVDEDKCAGCWMCILVCPFGAIKQDLVQRKAVRCDLCQDEDIPVCVAKCPNEALVYAESDIVGAKEHMEIIIQ